MIRWAQEIRSVWEQFEVGIDEVVTEALDRVLVSERLNGRGSGSGAEMEYRVSSAYWFQEGRIVKRKSFVDKGEALDGSRRFWICRRYDAGVQVIVPES